MNNNKENVLWTLKAFFEKEKEKAQKEMRTWNEVESFYASGKRAMCEEAIRVIETYLQAS